MTSMFVVVRPPAAELLLCVLQGQEPVFVQALGSKPTVEGFDQGVVRRLARTTEVKLDAVGVSPLIQRLRGEFGSIVHADRFGQPALGADLHQHASDVLSAEPLADFYRQTLA